MTAYSFGAHPQAVVDLRQVPSVVRDSALDRLEQVVRGLLRGLPLGQVAATDLRGCRKIYLGDAADWRAVYLERAASPSAVRPREINLLAVGARRDLVVYRSAAQRLLQLSSGFLTPHPLPPRARAALTASVHAPRPGHGLPVAGGRATGSLAAALRPLGSPDLALLRGGARPTR
ncbi:hypothetical protein [Streptacidiphilus neutrinimicus]|uniref:hypothetical protein n=1 Tax=Streptacidiphilus neutrinimicus TaxID=105420 RepID=UPI000693FDB5|nr:hypothetical protein [Streptacidiphilus neutrinimicus]